jgi:hypothetical protein
VEREPRPIGHENDVSTPAPGDLERVRSFLSLHDHIPGSTRSLTPGLPSIARWLVRNELATEREVEDRDALAWAAEVRTALRSLVPGVEPDSASVALLDDAARRAEVELRFADRRLVPAGDGVEGAIGSLLATAFLAEREGTWARLRHCSNPECVSVFYDRSKNRSGRWCSMRSCGNQAKVRAYRERHRTAAAG